MTDPKVPGSKAEADAARVALAKYDVTRLEAAQAVLTGKKLEAALAEVKALLEGGLPERSSIAANLPRLESWVAEVSTNLEADLEQFRDLADPEAAKARAEERKAAGGMAGERPVRAGRPVPMIPASGPTA